MALQSCNLQVDVGSAWGTFVLHQNSVSSCTSSSPAFLPQVPGKASSTLASLEQAKGMALLPHESISLQPGDLLRFGESSRAYLLSSFHKETVRNSTLSSSPSSLSFSSSSLSTSSPLVLSSSSSSFSSNYTAAATPAPTPTPSPVIITTNTESAHSGDTKRTNPLSMGGNQENNQEDGHPLKRRKMSEHWEIASASAFQEPRRSEKFMRLLGAKKKSGQ